jgi:hypothetical protein
MRGTRRTLKVLGFTVFAALALSVAASAASASTWTINGSTLVGSESVGCSASGTLALQTTVAGSAVTITATSVECVEGKITNPGGLDSGKLVFSGLTVDGLSSPCSAGTSITTKALSTELVAVSGFASGLGDTFKPTEGTTFATVTLTGKGCGAAAGSFPVKGSIVGEAEPLNTPHVSQPLKFGITQDEKVSDALTFGTSAAHLVGTVNNFLTGANSGLSWGAE